MYGYRVGRLSMYRCVMGVSGAIIWHIAVSSYRYTVYSLGPPLTLEGLYCRRKPRGIFLPAEPSIEYPPAPPLLNTPCGA